MLRDFQRVAIVNRGEPAMRFIHALREHNAERGTAVRAITLVTEVERSALFAREADEVYDIGSPTFVDPRDGRSKSSYRNVSTILRQAA